MDQARRIVMRQALERVAEGVAEIEQRALALFGFVGDDDAGLGGAAGRDRLGAGRTAGENLPPTGLEKLEEIAVADQAVFDDFGIAGAKLAPAQRIEAAGIGENERGLVERADQILAVRAN